MTVTKVETTKGSGVIGEETLSVIEDAVKSLTMDFFSKVILKTPVDADRGVTAGRARANWIASNKRAYAYERKITDEKGNSTIDKVSPVVEKFNLGEKIFLANNVPYIGVLELGLYPNPPKSRTGKTINGYSTQAPVGMVRVSLSDSYKDFK